MPNKRPLGYKTPHQIIESTHKINKYEVLFTKEKGSFKELKQNSKPLYRNVVSEYFNKDMNFKKSLHNHIYTKKILIIPSPSDLVVNYYEHHLYPNTSNLYTISLIKRKKEVGRTHYMLTEKTYKLVDDIYKKHKNELGIYKDDVISYIQGLMQDSKIVYSPDLYYKELEKNHKDLFVLYHKMFFFDDVLETYALRSVIPTVKDRKQLINKLVNDLGIKIRFTPMPGYKFNPEKIIFEKSK